MVVREDLPYTFDVRPLLRMDNISSSSRIRERAKYPSPAATSIAQLEAGPHPEGIKRQTRWEQMVAEIADRDRAGARADAGLLL